MEAQTGLEVTVGLCDFRLLAPPIRVSSSMFSRYHNTPPRREVKSVRTVSLYSIHFETFQCMRQATVPLA